jgi:hypothetical protein
MCELPSNVNVPAPFNKGLNDNEIKPKGKGRHRREITAQGAPIESARAAGAAG